MKMKNKLLVGLATLFMLAFLPAMTSAAVGLKAECAYDDTLAKAVCIIYADSGTDTLISGGVRLEYDTNELTFQSAQKNEEDWFFGDGTPSGNYPYMDPEDVAVSGSKRAVITVVGKLRESVPAEGNAGERIKIVTISFGIVGSNGAPYDITLDLARGGDYENFVSTSGALLDDGIAQKDVIQAEAGDADTSGSIDSADAGLVSQIFFRNIPDTIFADCNLDGSVDAADAGCISQKFFQ